MPCKGLLLALFLVACFLIPGGENTECADPIRLPLFKAEISFPEVKEPHLSVLKNLGSVSCSSSNCHGSNQEETLRYQRAYTTWRQKDPHARAFETLSNDLSVEIGKRLGLPRPPTQSRVCLNCHAAPMNHQKINKEELAPADLELASEGVSCEACHGVAEKWLEPHRSYEWNSTLWPEKRKENLGFKETKNIATRAKQCAQCHVGGEGKDVNHQLIAAGHPRLFFEYAASMGLYSQTAAHWDVSSDERRFAILHPGKSQYHTLNSWMIGKLVSAQQSLELLNQRAISEASDWPELTEYSCYSCHHDLNRSESKTSNWRQKEGQTGKQQQIPWNQWNLAFVPEILKAADLDKGNETETMLFNLSGKMNRIDNLSRRKIAELSLLTAEQLEDCLQKYHSEKLALEKISAKLIEFITESKVKREINNWEIATQYYLMLVPLSGDHLQKANSDSKSRFEKIKSSLQFSAQTEHGKLQSGLSIYNSPRWENKNKLEQIRQNFDDILSEMLKPDSLKK